MQWFIVPRNAYKWWTLKVETNYAWVAGSLVILNVDGASLCVFFVTNSRKKSREIFKVINSENKLGLC